MYFINYQDKKVKVVECLQSDAQLISFLWDKDVFKYDASYITLSIDNPEGLVLEYESVSDWNNDNPPLTRSKEKYYKLIDQWTKKAIKLGYLSQQEV